MNCIYVIHLMGWDARPFVVAGNDVVSVSAVCDQVDQGDQVVPAHQVDDIDEVHEQDPVHQVDHKDEHTSHDITSHDITKSHPKIANKSTRKNKKHFSEGNG